jgi:hypothetical protein
METQFTWIAFYKELAQKLLPYRHNIQPLLEFIYSLKDKNGKPQTAYIHDSEGNRVPTIDPFSVIAIFNRNSKWENRSKMCQEFKQFLNLQVEVPTDFDGIPVVNPMQSFFFDWFEYKKVEPLWDLFEKVVTNQSCEKELNDILLNGQPIGMLTMALYWTDADSFLALDSRNRAFLHTFGFNTEKVKTADDYFALLDKVKQAMQDGTLPYNSFSELSHDAYEKSFDKGLWMWHGDTASLQQAFIECGSSAPMIPFADIKSKEQMIQAYQTFVKNKDNSIPTMYWQFISEMKEGDTIVVFDTKKENKKQYHLLYGYGTISSGYTVNPQNENPLHREVQWHRPFLTAPVAEYKTQNALYIHKVEGLEAYNIRKLLHISDTTMATNHSDIVALLKSNKNLVLTGAPGTGKTHLAKELALALGADESTIRKVQFHPSYDYTDFVEGIRPQLDGTFRRVDGEFKEFCKRALESTETIVDNFEEVWGRLVDYLNEHDFIIVQLLSGSGEFRVELNEYGTGLANRTYEDGVYQKDAWVNGKSKFFSKDQLYNIYRGLKGVPAQGHDNYRKAIVNYLKKYMGLQDYNATPNKSNKPFVFIIDEINRGELSKIFGELFGAIEKGYRGEKGRVRTQYQNMIAEGDPFKEGFYVPENVYIIGTMNDIDRSVESMDFAMRRRFAWKEVTAAESYDAIIANNNAFNGNKAEVEAHMARLNAKIKESLGQAYQIGAAYFLELKNDDFESLWKNHLEGLIFEYFRGERDAEQKVEELHGIFING